MGKLAASFPFIIFFSLALCVLFIIGGAWLYRKFIAKPRITTKIEWYEKRIEIPVKVETKPGQGMKPTAETARRDTIWLTAPCDSVRKLAMKLSRPDTVVYKDTLAFSDSLLSFTATEITGIGYDPWTRLFSKARMYQDATLKAARVETTETVTQMDWVITLGAFVAGLILALLVG